MENHPEGHDQPISNNWISRKNEMEWVFRSESEDNSMNNFTTHGEERRKTKTKINKLNEQNGSAENHKCSRQEIEKSIITRYLD